jgi:RNA recognition motif-containing protein
MFSILKRAQPAICTRITLRVLSSKIYVGNLSCVTTDETLKRAFESYGNITDTLVLKVGQAYDFVTAKGHNDWKIKRIRVGDVCL